MLIKTRKLVINLKLFIIKSICMYKVFSRMELNIKAHKFLECKIEESLRVCKSGHKPKDKLYLEGLLLKVGKLGYGCEIDESNKVHLYLK